jgi:rare lipoprotein A
LALLLKNGADWVDSAVKIRFLLFFLFGFSAALAEAQVDSLLIQEGTASYYGKRFHGRRTASGEIFHLDSMTAAHKNLPFGTWVRVTREGSEEYVVVKINDRLPQRSRHVIDLSRGAGTILGLLGPGFAPVRIEVLNLDELDRLIVHFEEREKLGLRLRPYSQVINVPKRELDLSLKEPKVGGLKFYKPVIKQGVQPKKARKKRNP